MYRGQGEEAAADRERLEKCTLAELQVRRIFVYLELPPSQKIAPSWGSMI